MGGRAVSAIVPAPGCSPGAGRGGSRSDGNGLCDEHRRNPRPVAAPTLGVWCPTCKQDMIPNTFTGACVWCGTHLEGPPARKEPPVLTEIVHRRTWRHV